MGTEAALRLGPLDVSAEGGALAAYRAATAPGEAETVPLAFTLRWLTVPAVRDALAGLLAPAEVMVHEAQKFGLLRPLRPDERYKMTLEVWRTETPARVAALARIAADDGRPVLTIETTLRLVRPSPAP